MERIKRLTEDEANNLERMVSEEEVWRAINDCGKNKSPGPDGFTIGFILRFWDIVKKDLMAAIEWF